MEGFHKISHLVLVLSLLLSLFSFTSSSKQCHPNDKSALLKIKSHFNNASPFAMWHPKSDCCKWVNVGCYDDANPGRVTSLTVADVPEISGEIASAVGDLPFLTFLRFFSLPNLTGSIPSAITRLSRLQYLVLNSNKLSGSIPGFLSRIPSLQLIDVSDNGFVGPIPPSLSLLPNLFELDIFHNQLTGSIPDSFGSFRTGLTLQVNDNKLSGPIPKSLSQANLTTVNLAGNRFTGDISFLFANDKPLENIVMRENRFKFDFSDVDLPRGLKLLDISHNLIYGSLPKRLGQLPLEFINVSYNRLCGPVPTGRRLKEFKPFRFEHNKCLCGPPLPACK